MNKIRRYLVVCFFVAMCLASGCWAYCAETISPPLFTARVDKASPGKAVQINVEIAGAKQLYLVATGSNYGWADWAEPRLSGPKGELKLTELPWKFASVGYGRPHVDGNVHGDRLRIDGKPVSYGIGVHDPSLVIYDVPDGYTHFKARGGLDSGGSQGPVTFSVYAGNPLLDIKNPQLWTRDHNRLSVAEPDAYIETFCGDRLPGEVVETPESDEPSTSAEPSHFFVQTTRGLNKTGDVDHNIVRVIRRFVRRIVWQRSPGVPTRYQPGTVWYRNGAQVAFRAARFSGSTLRMLTSEGIVTTAITDLARIDFPHRDPWDAYFDSLALLSPHLEAELSRLETSDGLIATTSNARLRCLPPRHHDTQPQVWRVGLQPAWALDMLWLPHIAIGVRRQFAPHRLPLTRLEPVQTILAGAVGGGSWPPRKNQNVQGGPLATAGKAYAWGFGTQADTELHFALHPTAQYFRTRVGLDQLAGAGGCARARVFADSTASRPLWESPLLVGSSRDADTNSIRLPQQDGASSRLVLQADSAHAQRPKDADPFDIRDFVDWVDPELQLDATKLQFEVAQGVTQWVPAWTGWDVQIDGDEMPWLDNLWSEFDSRPAHFRVAVRSGEHPLRLSRRIDVDASTARLLITVSRPPEVKKEPLELEILVDDQSIRRCEIPTRGRDHRNPPQIEVALDMVAGNTVTLTIVQHPSDDRPSVEWLGIDLKQAIQEGPAADETSAP